jgi:DNA polymerase elongation subunit (family B)
LEEGGWKVVQADTDGLIAVCPINNPFLLSIRAEEITRQIQEKIRKEAEEVGAKIEALILEPVVYKDVLTARVKKKYRARKVWEDGEYKAEIVLIGFEAKKTDAFPLLKQVQEHVHQLLCECPPEKVLDEIVKYLREVRKEIFSGDADDKLVITTHLRRGMDAYKNLPPHVRAAMEAIKQGLRDLTEIQWVVVSEDGGIKAAPVLDKIPKITESGYRYYFKRIISMVADQIGEKEDDLATRVTTATLDTFS